MQYGEAQNYFVCNKRKKYASNRDRTSDLKIFSLTLSQLSYRSKERVFTPDCPLQSNPNRQHKEKRCASNRDRTSDLKIFSLTLSQLSYRSFGDILSPTL
jgi:hypothetical protein